MRAIDVFVSKVFDPSCASFSLDVGGGKIRYFMKLPYGYAKIIYMTKENDSCPETTAERIAIIDGETICFDADLSYVFNEETSRNWDTAPKEISSLYMMQESLVNGALDRVFPDFWASLDTSSAKSSVEVEEDKVLAIAREQILFPGITTAPLDYTRETCNIPSYITTYDIIQCLSGVLNIDEFVLDKLEKDRDYYLISKRIEEDIADALSSRSSIVKDWEKRFAEAVGSIGGIVTVDFERDGRFIAGIKMAAQKLASRLLSQEHFYANDYARSTDEDVVLVALGAAYNDKTGEINSVKCSDISQISYRGKTIYKRSNN